MKINRRYAAFLLFIFLGLIGYLSILKYLHKRQQPNILLITLDALRPDHLGCYGYKRNTSPNIDRISGEGIIFLNAISQSSFTPASMVSLLTSTYPFTHGVYAFGDKISGRVSTLSGLLKQNDFQTGFFSSHVGIATIAGFEDCFDVFYSIWTYKEEINNKNTKVTEINPRIMKWIEKNKNKNFFLWIHYIEPHYPMNPPPAYLKIFLNEKISKTGTKVPISDKAFGLGGIPRRLAASNDYISDLNYYINLYDATIRYIDDQIGELMGSIKKMGLDKKTLIIISSDHGESLGEHNQYFNHGFQLYDEVIKIPLIIKLGNSFQKGKKIVNQVQQIDIAPTILEILRIRKPSSMIGESLIPLIKGNSGCNNKFAYSLFDNKISARTEEWKLIYDKDGSNELYDMRLDPLELNNLAFTEKERVDSLKQKLDVFLKQGSYAGKKSGAVLNEEGKRRLRSLGYVQ